MPRRSFLAYVIPVGGRFGHPSHPIAPGEPGAPDQGLPGEPEYPDQGLPGEPEYPDQGLPGFPGAPSFPIHLPPPGYWPMPPHPGQGLPPAIPGFGHPDQGLPVAPGVPIYPDQPIYIDGAPNQDLPLEPGTVWPPLPPQITGKVVGLMVVFGLGYRWICVDADLRPPGKPPVPPTGKP